MTDHDRQRWIGERRVSRRVVLQGSAVAGATAFLAACGTGGGESASPAASASGAAPTASEAAATAAPPDEPLTGPLNFANWPAYIDLNEDETESPTLVDFTATYGVEVNYVEEIQSNEEFLATIAPQLEAGLDTGWDLMALTDYMAARLIGKGWIEAIDQSKVPNAVANLREGLKGQAWDPDQTYHYPWQTFADGVGYNRVNSGLDLTSTAEMFLPQFSGKVTMLTGYQDTFSMIGLLLKSRGEIENLPADLTNEDGDKIFAFLKPYVDDGFIRAFTGNEYIQDFPAGNTWVALVYSGDLASSAGPDDFFAYPTEGLVAATDNMLIPKGAAHKAAAEAMIDFVYDVANAARLAAWIYYISPVDGAAEAIKELDPELATNPLLFPPEDVVARTYAYPAYDDEKNLYFEDLSAQLEGA
jgi:spermidine/putrescine transport system substrate-binding protein